jgi:hypothetical protein
MRLLFVNLASAMAGAFALAATPTTSPTTAPIRPSTTQAATKPAPKQRYGLLNGAVKFMLPGDWKEQERAADDKTVKFGSPDGRATLTVHVTPQEYALPQHDERFREMMKNNLIAAMKKQEEATHVTATYGPKSETDDRFLARIHDTIREGHVSFDEIHLYRGAGPNLLSVETAVKTDDRDIAKPYHKVGEDTCLSIVLGQADRKPQKKQG